MLFKGILGGKVKGWNINIYKLTFSTQFNFDKWIPNNKKGVVFLQNCFPFIMLTVVWMINCIEKLVVSVWLLSIWRSVHSCFWCIVLCLVFCLLKIATADSRLWYFWQLLAGLRKLLGYRKILGFFKQMPTLFNNRWDIRFLDIKCYFILIISFCLNVQTELNYGVLSNHLPTFLTHFHLTDLFTNRYFISVDSKDVSVSTFDVGQLY